MSQSTTPPARVPNTVETVVLDPRLDILLWVEDAPITPCRWDDHVSEPTAGFREVKRQPSALGLPEDPEEGDPVGDWESSKIATPTKRYIPSQPCPQCRSRKVLDTGRGIHGDYNTPHGMQGLDLAELQCEACGFRWLW